MKTIKMNTNKVFNIFLLILLLVGILIRFDINDRPILFNEGTYAYIADKMLNEDMKYLDIYDSKPPGIYYIFMAFMTIFGNKQTSFHLVSAISDTIIILLIFVIASSFFNKRTALLSCALYSFSFLPVSVSVGGFLEPPMMVFMLLCVLFYIKGIKNNKYSNFFLAGFFLSISFMIKQPAIVFFLSVILYQFSCIYYRDQSLLQSFKQFFSFLIGFLSLFIPIVLSLILTGRFAKYIFSVYYSNFSYGPGFIEKLSLVIDYVLNTIPFLIFLSIISFIMLLSHLKKKSVRFLFSWLIPVILLILLASDFQAHYLIQLFPILVITISFVCMWLDKNQPKKILYFFLILIFLLNAFYLFFDLRSLHTTPVHEKHFYEFVDRTFDFGILSDILYSKFDYRLTPPFSRHRSAFQYSSYNQQVNIARFLDKYLNETDKFITTVPTYLYLIKRENNYRYVWINPMIAGITDISDFSQYASDSKYFLFEYWQDEQGHISVIFLNCIKKNWKLIESIDNWHTHVYKNIDSEVCRDIW